MWGVLFFLASMRNWAFCSRDLGNFGLFIVSMTSTCQMQGQFLRLGLKEFVGGRRATSVCYVVQLKIQERTTVSSKISSSKSWRKYDYNISHVNRSTHNGLMNRKELEKILIYVQKLWLGRGEFFFGIFKAVNELKFSRFKLAKIICNNIAVM